MHLDQAAKAGRGDILLRPAQPPSKPEPGDTPWRSIFYASSFQSADGNPYAPGDTIPHAEAIRQGVIDDEPPPEIRPLCKRCRGKKFFTNPRPKGHKIDCGCRFCQRCPRCGGVGREPKEEMADVG